MVHGMEVPGRRGRGTTVRHACLFHVGVCGGREEGESATTPCRGTPAAVPAAELQYPVRIEMGEAGAWWGRGPVGWVRGSGEGYPALCVWVGLDDVCVCHRERVRENGLTAQVRLSRSTFFYYFQHTAVCDHVFTSHLPPPCLWAPPLLLGRRGVEGQDAPARPPASAAVGCWPGPPSKLVKRPLHPPWAPVDQCKIARPWRRGVQARAALSTRPS